MKIDYRLKVALTMIAGVYVGASILHMTAAIYAKMAEKKEANYLLDRASVSQLSEKAYPSRSEKLDSTNWDVNDKDGNGTIDELITPHRNSYYGDKGSVYTRGNKDLEGEVALDFANLVIAHKKDLAKMAGNKEAPYWFCRVDDFDGDGNADKISWPRLEGMPVYEAPFTQEMYEKSSKIVAYEDYVLNYIRKK